MAARTSEGLPFEFGGSQGSRARCRVQLPNAFLSRGVPFRGDGPARLVPCPGPGWRPVCFIPHHRYRRRAGASYRCAPTQRLRLRDLRARGDNCSGSIGRAMNSATALSGGILWRPDGELRAQRRRGGPVPSATGSQTIAGASRGRRAAERARRAPSWFKKKWSREITQDESPETSTHKRDQPAAEEQADAAERQERGEGDPCLRGGAARQP